ncbi:serine protease 1-like [Ptiloglossa arizonensis]|uniref:serine protease 1-like n=1 Tax=Ptiloglossa arizonensis TaxID=3350558 RepID=UPI003FA0D97C
MKPSLSGVITRNPYRLKSIFPYEEGGNRHRWPTNVVYKHRRDRKSHRSDDMHPKLIAFAALLAAVIAVPTIPHRGVIEPLLDSRIVGGADAKAGQFPWQVSLQWGYFVLSHFCGGTILNSQWIITAGHCVLAIPSYGSFVVKAGKTNLKLTESTEQSVKVVKSFVHEKYPGNVAPYDIALLKLEKPLKLNEAVKAIGLPASGSIPTGTSVLSGWGSTSKTSSVVMPDTLQYVELPIITLARCKEAVEELTGPSPLDPTNVCSGPLTGGYSACNGDSGGPLIINNKGRIELVGIVSWGIIPCGTRGAPSVYTRTSAFNDWIQNTIAKN